MPLFLLPLLTNTIIHYCKLSTLMFSFFNSHLLQEWLYMHYQEWRLGNTTVGHQILRVQEKKMEMLVTPRVPCQHSLMERIPSVLSA